MRPESAFINRDTRRPGEITAGPAAAFDWSWGLPRDSHLSADDPPRLNRADPIDLCLRPIGGDRSPRRDDRLVRVPREIALLEHYRLQVIAVAAHKPVAPTVERH